MIWFFLGLVIYFLVLHSERALLAITPHDLERLRTEGSPNARWVQRLVIQVRPAVAALLLARIWLEVLITVSLALYLTRFPVVRTGLYRTAQSSGLPGWLVWWAAGAGFAVLLAFVFWGLKRWRWPVPGTHRLRSGLWLIAPFILFWKMLFSPFLPKEQSTGVSQDTADGRSPANSVSGFNGEKQRDIELLKSIVKFSDVTVKQVMQPRSKVVAVDFRTHFHDLLLIVREAGFSRMPVYDEDLDNVTGILYVKDLVPHLDKPDDFEWQSIIRTNLLLVPEAKRVSELLQEFKRNRRHMAIVVDEYGGSAGIVTMEDILEEITGEIRDEFDEESEIRYRKLDENNYLFEGQTLLNDVCRIAGLAAGAFDEIRGTADTLAGLALELKGDIPKAGAELTWNGYLLTIISADNRRIQQVKLTMRS